LLQLAALALTCSPVILPAQSTFQPNRNVIVLDPAHGGADTGARIAANIPEKQITLALANRLKPLLAAAGFTVVTTRDADLSDPAQVLGPDQRAGTANHAHALACILIHSTPSGSGAHLFTSSLPAPSQPTDLSAVIPWDTAQSGYIPLSLRLANELGASLLHAKIPPLVGHASIRPIDNLTCPTVAIELAPLPVSDSSPTSPSDPTYQHHAAQAIVEALISWRNHAAPPAPAPPAPKPTSTPAPGAPQ
jgi:N-acetylmuramoyl-L-alanine amidase